MKPFPRHKTSDRTSTITNSYIAAIIPTIEASDEEKNEVLKILDMSISNVCCVYCGDDNPGWDHFRSLVKDKEPTGYITEIYNLVPACSTCNSSKGKKEWREWLYCKTNKSLKARGKSSEFIDSVKERLERFEEFTSKKVTVIPKEIFIANEWENYKKMLDEVNALLNNNTLASKILPKLEEYCKKK